ncbi:hypothetical protein M9Y10_002570 [Tritrichomonas musculus]|uniref:Chorein N-terminal domain-containing protein n=1 Tax=Tritrichomonas musculus TaxID=1915356 RepID=A0ABR2LA85_9EUKA
MLGAFFNLTDSVIKKFAKQYIRHIQIESLPLWKGQATIDNINLNTDGINQTIIESGGVVMIQNITVSRLSVKAPFTSPGTEPILVNLHSVDIRLQILDENTNENNNNDTNNNNESQTPPPPEPAQQQDQDQPQTENTSYIAKLTSNILICADGVFLGIIFNGFDIRLVATDLKIHILPNETKITAQNVRASGSNTKTNLKLNLNTLIIDIFSGQNPKTIVDIIDLTGQVVDTIDGKPHVFDIIELPVSLHMIFEGQNILVHSSSDIQLTYNLDSIPSLIDIINAFATEEPQESSPLPNLNIQVKSATVNFNLNSSLGLILKINDANMNEGSFNIESISAQLRILDDTSPIIDDFSITGTLKQIEKVICITADIDSIHISLDLNNDFIQLIKSIEIPKFPEPKQPPQQIQPIHKPKLVFTDHSCLFSEIPILKISNRIVDFSFERPIVPTLFCFDDCVQRTRLQLRVWDPTFNTFIAISSFESTSQMCTYRLPEDQLLSGTRWQLIFPEPLSFFPTFSEKSTIFYQTCESFDNQLSIKAKINNIILSVSSYNFPVAGLSISNISAIVDLSPLLQIVKVNASLGLSALLTNFRNSTMSSILDIPKLAFQLSQFPDFGSIMNIDTQHTDAQTAFPLQDFYSSNSLGLSVKIPSIHVNAVPTTIADFIGFLSTFSVSDIVAYKIINRADVPFLYQISDSSEIVTIEPNEEKAVTFRQGEVHYIKFPSFQTNIIFNSTGYYHISDINFIQVAATAPFSFTAVILSSVQFINILKSPLEVSVNSSTLSCSKILQNSKDVVTMSMKSQEDFTMKIKLLGITDWSENVKIDQNVITSKKGSSPIMMKCDVIEMLPQCYICSPSFCCWVNLTQKAISCQNGTDHLITQITFTPLLTFKNRLDVHVITSIGTIPPKKSLYFSSMPNNQIVIENNHTIDVRLPLKKSNPLNLLIQQTPAIVDTMPSANSIIVSPSFVFKNETNIKLVFKFTPEDKIFVLPNETVPLTVPRDLDWLSIGMEEKEGISWSPPIQIPATRDFTIKSTMGNLILFASINEFSALVAPKTVAINESDIPIMMKPSIRIDPDSQSQLLFWRGTQLAASFGFSKNAGFTDPILLDTNVIWNRKFVMNDAGQSLYYLTYSIQTSADPHAIIFHNDPSPPFTIVNQTSLNFVVFFEKHTFILASETTVYLPGVPEVLAFGRVGTKPFTVSLLFSQVSFVNDQGSLIYVKVEKRGNQVKATIAPNVFPKITRKLRTYLFAFIDDFKIFLYDDFSEPGFPKNVLTITLSPLSLNLMINPGEETKLDFSLDTLEIDQLSNYIRFPVLIRKMSRGPFVKASLSILNAYGGGIVLNNLQLNLSPFQLCVEECFIRFILEIISLMPNPNQDEALINNDIINKQIDDDKLKETETNKVQKLTPIYINSLQIKETKIFLSFATESFIHTDFRQVPINLSAYILNDTELFDVSLIQGIVSHYISDGLAAIPSLIGSLSLIGSPVNIINHSLKGIRDFYRTAFIQNDTILNGIGQGSMNIIRGATVGTLESFIGLAYSLEKSIGKLRPFTNNTNNNNTNNIYAQLQQANNLNNNVEINESIGPEMARAISSLVTTSVQEFSEDGILGFIKGAGKGIAGLVTVPTTALFRGLKNAGVKLLEKVGGRENDIEDSRIEKEIQDLPTVKIDDNDDEDDDLN